jgi:hypothetical protein
MSRKSNRRSSRKRKAPATPVARTRTVWAALLLSMTSVGGVLYLLQGGPTPRLDGLALPAMVAAAGPSSVEAVFQTRSKVDPSKWKAIVIHHSGSPYGTPARIEAEHRAMNLDGLGYHFIVGNGSGLGNGAVHVGYRWLDQLPGAHVAGSKGDWFNRNSIGICLVGDGRRREFQGEQMARTVELVSSLCDRLGIPPEQVYLHSDLASTDDPGRFFPEAAFREQLARSR